jgi:hypothetical protein
LFRQSHSRGQIGTAPLARLFLILISIAIGLLLAEGASRVVDRFGCRDNPGSFWEPDLETGWRHIAGASGWAQRCVRRKPEWRVYLG